MISTAPELLHTGMKENGGRSKSVAKKESPLKQRSFVFCGFSVLVPYHASGRVKKDRENACRYPSISYVSIVILLAKQSSSN
jgi:hypothetical protein